MRIWAHIANSLERGEPCALVTVAAVDGSTPREAGARMVVLEDGSFSGTIGGGTLEFVAIRQASAAARQGRSVFQEKIVSLGPDLGQCCGGRANLVIETFCVEDLATARNMRDLESEGSPFGTRSVIEGGRLAKRELLPEAPEDAFTLESGTASNTRILRERFGSLNRPLYLFGAGHVGKALILALAPLPFDVTWIDSRADQFPGPVPANVKKVVARSPSEILDDAPAGAFVLAMTHSHALDEEIMARALLLQKFSYCGVIGSKTKRARFLRRLRARGIGESLLSAMVCPVGHTEIRSKHPAAIAAGIAVDLLQRDEEGHQQLTASGGLAQIIPHGQ
ncbi:MAG: xanthine dehydrogenase accessory protein XdhC [Roseibium sp.]|nr:xanthine dehydrogenase accessory protein XdhC [Roseibium sp.]